MVTVKTEITGLRELAKNSAKLRKGFEGNILRTGLRGGARPVRLKARALVSVASGDLKKAIAASAVSLKRGVGVISVGIRINETFSGTDGFYGRFLELGTSKLSARPYLRPALEQTHQDGSIQDGFIVAINKGIAKALGRIRG